MSTTSATPTTPQPGLSGAMVTTFDTVRDGLHESEAMIDNLSESVARHSVTPSMVAATINSVRKCVDELATICSGMSSEISGLNLKLNPTFVSKFTELYNMLTDEDNQLDFKQFLTTLDAVEESLKSCERAAYANRFNGYVSNLTNLQGVPDGLYWVESERHFYTVEGGSASPAGFGDVTPPLWLDGGDTPYIYFTKSRQGSRPLAYLRSVADIVSKPDEYTWTELKQMRDGFRLVPGRQYILADFESTVSSPLLGIYRSHQMKLLLTAAASDAFYSTAKVIGSDVFAAAQFARWDVRYSLDNDNERPDSTPDGKGYISYLEDHNGNSAAFDFISIAAKAGKLFGGTGNYEEITNCKCPGIGPLDGIFIEGPCSDVYIHTGCTDIRILPNCKGVFVAPGCSGSVISSGDCPAFITN